MALRHEDITYIQGLPAGSLEDKELAIAFKSGEEGAYQAIYDRYESRVHGVCRRMLGQKGDAEEAAQETFLRMYQGLPRFNGRYQLGAWITRIATNVCLDQLRAHSRKPVDPVPMEVFESDASPADLSDPEELHMKNVDGWRVRRVLASLPPLHRAAIVLRDFEGLTYEEVAVALDITECQVKALIHRARKGFKRSWGASVASLFLPARLIERLRSVEGSVKDQASHLLTSGGQAAASCNIAIQQCGSFVAERVGGLAAAAAVTGLAVVTPVVAATAVQVADPAPIFSDSTGPSAWEEETPPQVKSKLVKREPSKDEEVGVPVVPEATQSPEAAPVTDPAPSPTPTAVASSSEGETEVPGGARVTPPPGESTTPAPSPSETAQPEPQGFSLAFAVDRAPQNSICDACRYNTQVKSETGRAVDGSLRQFTQSVQGVAAFGEVPAYGLQLQHSSQDSKSHSLSFSLWTAEGRYMYETTGGRLVASGSTPWGGLTYTYQGSYTLGGRPTQDEAMPQFGTYHATIEFSESQSRIVSSSFSLSEAAS